MTVLNLSKKDIQTISIIVAEKAMQMHKRGSSWRRGEEYLSCVDMGKIANKIQKTIGLQWDFDAVWNKSKAKSKIKK